MSKRKSPKTSRGSGYDERKVSVHINKAFHAEIKSESKRLGKSMSWVFRQAWEKAKPKLAEFPSGIDIEEKDKYILDVREGHVLLPNDFTQHELHDLINTLEFEFLKNYNNIDNYENNKSYIKNINNRIQYSNSEINSKIRSAVINNYNYPIDYFYRAFSKNVKFLEVFKNITLNKYYFYMTCGPNNIKSNPTISLPQLDPGYIQAIKYRPHWKLDVIKNSIAPIQDISFLDLKTILLDWKNGKVENDTIGGLMNYNLTVIDVYHLIKSSRVSRKEITEIELFHYSKIIYDFVDFYNFLDIPQHKEATIIRKLISDGHIKLKSINLYSYIKTKNKFTHSINIIEFKDKKSLSKKLINLDVDRKTTFADIYISVLYFLTKEKIKNGKINSQIS